MAELVRACWELGSRPELDSLRLRAWAHMLGFGGHWSTRSRRYSTIVTVLRRARVAFAKRRQARHGTPSMLARKADAQRFLTEMENSKLKGA